MGKLKDKVAIITGASGGVGSAAAALFSREGAKLVLVGRDEGRLSQAAAACDAERTRTVIADVSKPEDVASFVDTAARDFGGVDVLFANAAYEGQVASIARMELAEFDEVFATNVRGTFVAMQKVIPLMLERKGGSIVVTSSTAAIATFPGAAAYAASKAALLALVRTAATEVASTGIRVNALIPGGIDNDMSRRVMAMMASGQEDPFRPQIPFTVPAGRFASNEEIAKLALFFASDDASFCHGAALVADGGMTVL